jgi:hypothetical protein
VTDLPRHDYWCIGYHQADGTCETTLPDTVPVNIQRRPLLDTLKLILVEPISNELKVALIVSRIEADVRSLPPENATGSRDFGRGYSAAVRDVLALLA